MKFEEDAFLDWLFVREQPVPAPLALVFGAMGDEELRRRVEHAVRLQRAGLAQRLLLTGGGAPGTPRTEAARMAEIVRELGVPDDTLLVEETSTNTFENASLSCELLQHRSLLEDLDTVLLVSAEWHMRRVLLTMQRAFPASIRLVCCPPTEGCTARTWRHTAACEQIVRAEATILRSFLDLGILGPSPS